MQIGDSLDGAEEVVVGLLDDQVGAPVVQERTLILTALAFFSAE
jgi:hypothetical protein